MLLWQRVPVDACDWVSPGGPVGLQAQVPRALAQEPQQGHVAALALKAEEVRALCEAP